MTNKNNDLSPDIMNPDSRSDAPTDKMITILGPTASGKTNFAVHLASKINGEIISADSRQIYRGMDLGTGKDLEDYTIEGTKIPYHLIDIRPAGDKYTLFDYHQDFHRVYNNILDRGKTAVLCGGTGLYIESVIQGYQLPDVPKNEELRKALQKKPQEELIQLLASYQSLHNTTDTDNPKRTIRAIEIADFKSKQKIEQLAFPPVDAVIFGINIDRETRRNRISSRLKKRLEEGMIDEVRQLLDQGVSAEDLIYYGLEYKFLTFYVIGKISYDAMFTQLEIAIHQFAKRQMTWYRGMKKRGLHIHWIDYALSMEEKVEKALQIISEY